MAISRRSFLVGSAAGATGLLLVNAAGGNVAVAQPHIQPRSAWAGGLPVKGTLVPEDVRFLLIHHTESSNTYTAQQVPAQIRSFYATHTGPEKGWPDVAYNFFVDRFGGIWEGRQGSLAGPVRGSATGGNQGFSQLCCFIGSYMSQPPPAAAMQAMTHLLAWLASRYRIDLSGRQSVTFTSLGSNMHKAGVAVRCDPVAAHRQMSYTNCPGDALFPLVRSQLLPGAAAMVAGAALVPLTGPTPAQATATTPPAQVGQPPAGQAGPGQPGAGADASPTVGQPEAPMMRRGGATPISSLRSTAVTPEVKPTPEQTTSTAATGGPAERSWLAQFGLPLGLVGALGAGLVATAIAVKRSRRGLNDPPPTAASLVAADNAPDAAAPTAASGRPDLRLVDPPDANRD